MRIRRFENQAGSTTPTRTSALATYFYLGLIPAITTMTNSLSLAVMDTCVKAICWDSTLVHSNCERPQVSITYALHHILCSVVCTKILAFYKLFGVYDGDPANKEVIYDHGPRINKISFRCNPCKSGAVQNKHFFSHQLSYGFSSNVFRAKPLSPSGAMEEQNISRFATTAFLESK